MRHETNKPQIPYYCSTKLTDGIWGFIPIYYVMRSRDVKTDSTTEFLSPDLPKIVLKINSMGLPKKS